jgi:hypothetical protein
VYHRGRSLAFKPNPFPVIHQHSSNLVHSTHTYLPVKMEQTECSETSAYKLQTPWNYPKESIQHLEHGESLKSRIYTNASKTRAGKCCAA